MTVSVFSPVGCNGFQRPFRCKVGVCLPRNKVCDIQKDCPDGEDEDQGCGSYTSHVLLFSEWWALISFPRFFLSSVFFCFRSDRGWNGSRCDFEQGWCGWNNTLDDHSDWIRHNGSTPTSGTGPSFDNTFKNSTGMYVFVDMSSTKDLGHSTVLKSPPFPPPPKYHNNPMSTYFNSCQVSRFQLRRGIKNEAQHLASLPSSIDTVTCAERPRAWVLRTQLRGIQRTFWSSTEWKGVPI